MIYIQPLNVGNNILLRSIQLPNFKTYLVQQFLSNPPQTFRICSMGLEYLNIKICIG